MPLEITDKIKILNNEILLLKKNIDWDKSNSELKDLIKISERDKFWDDPKNAQKIMKEIKLKENMINLVNKINQDYLDIKELIELADISFDKMFGRTKIFVNGVWIGIHDNPEKLYTTLILYRRNGLFNVLTINSSSRS